MRALLGPRPVASTAVGRPWRLSWPSWHPGDRQAVRCIADDGEDGRARLDKENPRRRWGRGGAFNGRFAEEVESWTEPSVATKMTRRCGATAEVRNPGAASPHQRTQTQLPPPRWQTRLSG